MHDIAILIGLANCNVRFVDIKESFLEANKTQPCVNFMTPKWKRN